MKYRVGQKVVYIGPDFSGNLLLLASGRRAPVPRSVYTVRGRMVMGSGEPGYVFEEIVNEPGVCIVSGLFGEMHTNERFLRPLIERKTDISAFHEILRDAERQVYRSFRDKVKA